MTDQTPEVASADSPYATGVPLPTVDGAYVGNGRTNTLAIVSLVSSLFISIVGVVTGFIALRQIKKTGESGRGLAIAGLCIGGAGILVSFVFLVLCLFAAIPMGASFR